MNIPPLESDFLTNIPNDVPELLRYISDINTKNSSILPEINNNVLENREQIIDDLKYNSEIVKKKVISEISSVKFYVTVGVVILVLMIIATLVLVSLIYYNFQDKEKNKNGFTVKKNIKHKT